MQFLKNISIFFVLLIILTGCSFNFKSETVYDTSKLDLNKLPIGTVVKAKGSDTKIMIYANNAIRDIDNKKYRYVGVFYPGGYTSDDGNVFFDSTQIEEVYHLGYEEKK